MLTETDNADCEITVENDFGTMKTGSKKGVPYELGLTSNNFDKQEQKRIKAALPGCKISF